MWGKEKFLKKVFFPPHPLSFKNFQKGNVFFVLHSAFDLAEIPLGFASCFFVRVILSEVEIRAKRGSNNATRCLGSRTKKFDYAYAPLRMTPKVAKLKIEN